MTWPLVKPTAGIHDLIQIGEAYITTHYPHRCALSSHILPFKVQGSVILSSVAAWGVNWKLVHRLLDLIDELFRERGLLHNSFPSLKYCL